MQKEFSKKRNRQRGSATVEAVVAFTGFLFAIFAILGMVNFCRAQMLISAAVDASAKELSQYAYFYKMSGLQKFDKALNDKGTAGKKNINQVIGTVDNLYGTLGKTVDQTKEDAATLADIVSKGDVQLQDFETAVNKAHANADDIVCGLTAMTSAFEQVGNDPLLYMRSLVAIAGNEASNTVKRAIAVPLAKLFVQHHLGASKEEANQNLKALGVEDGLNGLNFILSSMFIDDNQEEIRIVVFYKVKLFQLLDWTPLEATISKQAVCRAWLGGDNVQTYVKADKETGFAEPEKKPEGEGENTPDAGEEKEEPKQEEQLSYEGSYWHMGIDEHGYDDQAAAFDQLLADSYGVTREEWEAGMALYGRDDYNHAYGVSYCIDASKVFDNMIYLSSVEDIYNMEQLYIESGGERGYEPGSTVMYTHVIYVPENISDSELAKIQAEAEKMAVYYREYAKEQYGLEVSTGFEIVKGGGNYDYGSEEQP